jgi:hypothetical protein
MKKIKTLRILLPFVLLLFLIIGGCTETLVLSANFRITDWEQDYYQYLGEWGNVWINYEIENTGNVDIDYFEVYFEITCEDGTKYYSYDIGFYARVGQKYSFHFWVDVGGKKVSSVKITGWYLENWEYGLKTRKSL